MPTAVITELAFRVGYVAAMTSSGGEDNAQDIPLTENTEWLSESKDCDSLCSEIEWMVSLVWSESESDQWS